MSNILETLSADIVERDLHKDNVRLVKKWTKVGLLEGLKSDTEKANMSRLLENQTKRMIFSFRHDSCDEECIHLLHDQHNQKLFQHLSIDGLLPMIFLRH